MGKAALIEALPMQPGDVTDTAADVALLRALTGSVPQVTVEDGVARFVHWYRDWKESRRI